jgi:phthiocerol/phthiodiolone dimycocerosyl transferase-like enzyme
MNMLRELGSFERALLYSDRYAPFHLVSVLQLDGAPAPEIVRAALAVVQKRHPLLAARIVETRGRYYFESLPNPLLPLSVQPRQGDQDWLAIAESEMGRRIESDTGPLFRCTYLFEREGQRAELVLAISHFIIDGTGLVFLWGELLHSCRELLEGRTPEIAAAKLQPAADDLFPPAFRGASLAWRTLPFVLGQMGDEISYRWRTRGKAVLPLRAPSPGHLLTMQFPRPLAGALARRARVEGVTLNSLLNAAMLVAVNLNLYGGQAMPMRTFTFANLRPYVVPAAEAQALSPYISMLRYTVMVDPARGLWSVAHDLHAQIEASFKRGYKFIAAATSDDLIKMLTRLRAFRMGNTGLNYNGPLAVERAYGRISVRGVHGIVSPFDLGPEYSAQVTLFDEELSWDITFLEADMDQALAQRIAGDIRSSLEAVVADPARVSPS